MFSGSVLLFIMYSQAPKADINIPRLGLTPGTVRSAVGLGINKLNTASESPVRTDLSNLESIVAFAEKNIL